jgi:hypothetical protein
MEKFIQKGDKGHKEKEKNLPDGDCTKEEIGDQKSQTSNKEVMKIMF